MDNLPPVKNAPTLVTLDILRASAALLVVAEHARNAVFVPYGALPPAQHNAATQALYLLTRLGQEAVLVFFVLSGFLVGGQVIRRAREGRFSGRDYTVDRATRIFLPLAPAVIFAAVAGYVAHGQPLDPAQIAGNAIGLNGIAVDTLALNAPLWSLAYEIWFYILAGTVAIVCVGRGSAITLGTASAALLAFCHLDASLILVWVLGALVSAMDISRYRGAFALLGLAALAIGSAAIQVGRPSASIAQQGFITLAVGRGVFGIGCGMTLPWLISNNVNMALSSLRPLARSASFLAGMSYTLYLFHYPLLDVLGTHLARSNISVRSLGVYGAAVITSMIFAVVMYGLFERNTDSVRRWVKQWQWKSE